MFCTTMEEMQVLAMSAGPENTLIIIKLTLGAETGTSHNNATGIV